MKLLTRIRRARPTVKTEEPFLLGKSLMFWCRISEILELHRITNADELRHRLTPKADIQAVLDLYKVKDAADLKDRLQEAWQVSAVRSFYP